MENETEIMQHVLKRSKFSCFLNIQNEFLCRRRSHNDQYGSHSYSTNHNKICYMSLKYRLLESLVRC